MNIKENIEPFREKEVGELTPKLLDKFKIGRDSPK
jgi:hypothetical protein